MKQLWFPGWDVARRRLWCLQTALDRGLFWGGSLCRTQRLHIYIYLLSRYVYNICIYRHQKPADCLLPMGCVHPLRGSYRLLLQCRSQSCLGLQVQIYMDMDIWPVRIKRGFKIAHIFWQEKTAQFPVWSHSASPLKHMQYLWHCIAP